MSFLKKIQAADNEYYTEDTIHDKFYDKFSKLFTKLNLEAKIIEDIDDDEHNYRITGTKENLIKYYKAVSPGSNSMDLIKKV